MTPIVEHQRRIAERVPTPEPLPGVIGDHPMTVLEIARLGCRIRHSPRLPVNSKWPKVRFKWGVDTLTFKAEIVWSKLLLEGGEKSYESGLRFDDACVEDLEKLSGILAHYLNQTLQERVSETELPQSVTPFLRSTPFFGDPDASLPGEDFREYRLNDGKWTVREIEVPLQPRDGFCLPARTPEDEVEGYKTSFGVADDETRRMIRASLEIKFR